MHEAIQHARASAAPALRRSLTSSFASEPARASSAPARQRCVASARNSLPRRIYVNLFQLHAMHHLPSWTDSGRAASRAVLRLEKIRIYAALAARPEPYIPCREGRACGRGAVKKMHSTGQGTPATIRQTR